MVSAVLAGSWRERRITLPTCQNKPNLTLPGQPGGLGTPHAAGRLGFQGYINIFRRILEISRCPLSARRFHFVFVKKPITGLDEIK